MSRFAVLLYLTALLAVGCSHLPSEEDPQDWVQYSTESLLSGEYFAGVNDIVFILRFPKDAFKIRVSRSLDTPGNGLDQYTQEGMVLTRQSDEEYKIRIPYHYRIGHRLFFLVQWSQPSHDLPLEQGFCLEQGILYEYNYN